MRSDLSPFLNWSIEITFILLLVSMVIAFVRLVRGPSMPDRIVALDLLTLLAVGVIALFAIREDQAGFPGRRHSAGPGGLSGHRRLCALPGTARPASAQDGGACAMIGSILEILAGLLLLAGGPSR